MVLIIPCTKRLRFLQVVCSSKFPRTTLSINLDSMFPFGLYLATTKVHHSSSFFATARPKPRRVVSLHTTCISLNIIWREVRSVLVPMFSTDFCRWSNRYNKCIIYLEKLVLSLCNKITTMIDDAKRIRTLGKKSVSLIKMFKNLNFHYIHVYTGIVAVT